MLKNVVVVNVKNVVIVFVVVVYVVVVFVVVVFVVVVFVVVVVVNDASLMFTCSFWCFESLVRISLFTQIIRCLRDYFDVLRHRHKYHSSHRSYDRAHSFLFEFHLIFGLQFHGKYEWVCSH